jgi:hypothetical protein
MDRMELGAARWRTLPTAIAMSVVLAHASPAGATGAGEQGDTPWTPHVRALDDARAEKDADTAVRAWRGARQAALASRRWEALLDTGDATLRLAEVPAWRAAATARARELYLAAFFRARDEGSVLGIRRTADAFARLGDTQVAEQCLRAARELPAPEARGRVAAH